MVKVEGCSDCGNSPKNLFVQTMAVALETGEMESSTIIDDIVFEYADGPVLHGTEDVGLFLNERPQPSAIRVRHGIAHDRTGAANGVSALSDGTERRFSYVFEFKTAKAKSIARIFSYT